MTVDALLAPPLFGPVGDAVAWIDLLRKWVELRPKLPVRYWASAEIWSAATDDGLAVSAGDIKSVLVGAGMGSAYPSTMVLVGALRALMAYPAGEPTLLSWSSSGCLGDLPCKSTAASVIKAGLGVAGGDSAKIPPVAGATYAERETVDCEAPSPTTVDLSCVPTPDALLAMLDPIDHLARSPETAIWITALRIAPRARIGVFRLLDEFALSLPTDAAVRRDILAACAHVLMPAGERPAGLHEHPLRTGPGANDPQRTSRHGKAYRSAITMRGSGWRLHYWRGVDGVTFSNVTDHGGSDIYE